MNDPVRAFQMPLPLQPGAPADTPPPCRCCRGRGWLLGAEGWAACTWCEGLAVDPDSDRFAALTERPAAPERPRRAA